jgi:hypothetical protein
MKIKYIIAGLIAVSISFFSLNMTAQESKSLSVHDRVGNGWHMYTTVTLDEDGGIAGNTRLKNCNNVRGFTGGVFVVALDENDNAVYTTDVHSFGINASFFKKKVERKAEWSDCIPQEYLPKVAKIAVMQMHDPTNRVWTWVYDNREIIIKHAIGIAKLYVKYKTGTLGIGDAVELVVVHL